MFQTGTSVPRSSVNPVPFIHILMFPRVINRVMLNEIRGFWIIQMMPLIFDHDLVNMVESN